VENITSTGDNSCAAKESSGSLSPMAGPWVHQGVRQHEAVVENVLGARALGW